MCTIRKLALVQKLNNSIDRITHCRLDNSIGFDSAYPIHSDLSSGSHYSTIEKLVPDHKPPFSMAHTQEAQVWAGLLSGMVGDLAIKKKTTTKIKKNNNREQWTIMKKYLFQYFSASLSTSILLLISVSSHSLLSSRRTRERILISFSRRKKSRFFVKTANWPLL